MAATKPIITALAGVMLLHDAVTATNPDRIAPTSAIKSNFRVMFCLDPKVSLSIPIPERHEAAPTEARIVFMIVSAGKFPSFLS